jgi:1,4-dihydroxy-6-naphthoate synthase
MGEFWEQLTGLPVPLGSIVINRRIPEEIALKFNRILRRSIVYARENSLDSFDFVKANAREIESSVIRNHINLFVNDFSLSLGATGRKALMELFRIAGEKGIIPSVPGRIFLT